MKNNLKNLIIALGLAIALIQCSTTPVIQSTDQKVLKAKVLTQANMSFLNVTMENLGEYWIYQDQFRMELKPQMPKIQKQKNVPEIFKGLQDQAEQNATKPIDITNITLIDFKAMQKISAIAPKNTYYETNLTPWKTLQDFLDYSLARPFQVEAYKAAGWKVMSNKPIENCAYLSCKEIKMNGKFPDFPNPIQVTFSIAENMESRPYQIFLNAGLVQYTYKVSKWQWSTSEKDVFQVDTNFKKVPHPMNKQKANVSQRTK